MCAPSFFLYKFELQVREWRDEQTRHANKTHSMDDSMNIPNFATKSAGRPEHRAVLYMQTPVIVGVRLSGTAVSDV
jgi:hypothetical protein